MRNPIFFLTGLPAAGKTTIAKELARQIDAEILDGDDIRNLLKNTDFTPEGRKKHMLTVAELAWRFSKYTNVIVALVSPIKAVREEIKKKYSNVIEIYVLCDKKECIRRDPKGMYAKALKGEIKDFTGVSAPYEEPEVERKSANAKKTTFVDTEVFDVEQCVDVILEREYEQKEYSLFIGRWQCIPPHKGHLALFDTARKEGKNILIAIRNTGVDEKNPYSVEERKVSLRKAVPDAKIIVIPDIESVNYGRGVGYKINEIRLDKEMEGISATKLRAKC